MFMAQNSLFLPKKYTQVFGS